MWRRFRYVETVAARPGHNATVLVALASTPGMPVNISAGKETKLPPPAMEFSIPAITAAKKRKMAWVKCKSYFQQRLALVATLAVACSFFVALLATIRLRSRDEIHKHT